MKVRRVNKDGRVYYELRQGDKFIQHLGKSRAEYDATKEAAEELAPILRAAPHLFLDANLKRLINEAKRQQERLNDKISIAKVEPIPDGPFMPAS